MQKNSTKCNIHAKCSFKYSTTVFFLPLYYTVLAQNLLILPQLTQTITILPTLKGTARYADLLRGPAEGLDLRRRLFFPFGPKKELSMLFLLILGHFWCSVITSVTFSSNLSDFEKNPK